ncbi:MAG: hypothetical protein H0V28_07060 [Rubrobacteraceae bacterium]|nr:hypothetical protein [Rubrobacteraceae bacterium]
MTGSKNELRSTFTSTAGGVMTEEAGAFTGELDLLCRPEADGLHVSVRYAGTEDWYTVSGSPVRTRGDEDETREQLLKRLSTPGPVVGGNEKPVTLEGSLGA